MGTDEVLWGILPTGVALISIGVSAWSIARSFRVVQLILGIPAILGSLWAVWVIKRIFEGAWPTFSLQIAIGIASSLVAIQVACVADRSKLIEKHRPHIQSRIGSPNTAQIES